MGIKILVPVKRVADPSVRLRLKVDGTGVDLVGAKMSMNPFDAIAVEEAVRLKEQGIATEVIVVSIGTKVEDVLRGALAMGADRAVAISTAADLEPLAVAKLIRTVVLDEGPELVIMGKQAIDDDCGQTGQMLAALLNWGQATFASKLDVSDGRIVVTQEVDGGLQKVSALLPVVVTTDLRLNEPRFASLPNIMKAKNKPLKTVSAEQLGIDLRPRLEILETQPRARRSAGTRVDDVSQLISKLRTEAGLF